MICLVVVLALGACAEPPSPATPQAQPPAERSLARVSFAELPGWAEDAHEQALVAFKASCLAFERLAVTPGAGAALARDTLVACADAARVPAGARAAARGFFERWFQPYRVASSRGSTASRSKGLFTGYFEPELRGARQRSARYRVPLYRRPPDLVQVEDAATRTRVVGRMQNGAVVPYATRAEIESGALAGRRLEIAWVESAVDAFVLQVQGSGRIVLDDGATLRVGFDASNGWPYTSIGTLLVERGALPREAVTLSAIRAWLAANPDQARALMQENARYVFFREHRGPGPAGALGVPLTPGRSLAVDPRFVPLGLPVWLDTTDPRNGASLRRLVMAQDVGAAILGPVRGDLFWGSGPEAEDAAGRMQSRGVYYLLLPHAAAPRS